jgi:hypothetical protein
MDVLHAGEIELGTEGDDNVDQKVKGRAAVLHATAALMSLRLRVRRLAGCVATCQASAVRRPTKSSVANSKVPPRPSCELTVCTSAESCCMNHDALGAGARENVREGGFIGHTIFHTIVFHYSILVFYSKL